MRALKMLALSLVTLTAVTSTKAQTADEIVQKHIEAMGGADKLKSLNTVYSEGNLEVPGAELPMKLYQVNNKGMRLQFEYNGEENIQVVTSESGWMLMPVQQITTPTDLPAEQHSLAKRGLALGGELLNYKADNKKLELLGKETTNGQEAYKLKLSDADGSVTTIFLDASTYYMLRTEAAVKVQGQEVTIKATPGDYKKTPEGYVFPYSLVQESVGPPVTFHFSKIEVNKPIDEALFKKPS